MKNRKSLDSSGLLLSVVLSVGASLFVASAFALEHEPNQPEFVIKIVGYENAKEVFTNYRVTVGRSGLNASLNGRREAPSRGAFYKEFFQEEKDREDSRRKAVAKIDLSTRPGGRWVKPSPDGKYLFIGFEGIWADVMERVVVADSTTLKTAKDFKYDSSRHVVDLEWSSDSHLVAVLEKSERWSFAPLDLLALISGHGVSLKTFYVRLIDIRFRTVSEVLIAKHVRVGEALIARQSR